MANIPYKNALIIGAGSGISASVARRLRASGLPVVVAARNIEKLSGLADETGVIPLQVDSSREEDVARLFALVDEEIGPPEVVIYNASAAVRGPLAELETAAVERAVGVTAMGAFYALHHAAKRMVPAGKGALLLTGATASVKGFALSAPFAMGKFALRGLAQSAARELAPKGIHVAHIVVDGKVRTPQGDYGAEAGHDSTLDPEAIASSYVELLRQHRSAWTWELELRPWLEKF